MDHGTSDHESPEQTNGCKPGLIAKRERPGLRARTSRAWVSIAAPEALQVGLRTDLCKGLVSKPLLQALCHGPLYLYVVFLIFLCLNE